MTKRENPLQGDRWQSIVGSMPRLLSEKNIEILTDAEHARLWDLLIHQERDLTSRTNFFVIAESLFVLTYGIVVSFAPVRAYLFAICGIAVSLLWMILQYKALNDLSKLSARLKRVEISKHYHAWREECRHFFLSNEVMLIVMPVLSLVGWFIALAFNS